MKMVDWIERIDRYDDGSIPLHRAAQNGQKETVRFLLELNPFSVHTPDEDDWTAIHWAAYNGHHEIILQLLRAGADPSQEAKGVRPLHLAVRSSAYDAVVTLLQWSSQDLDAKDNDGCVPLHYALLRPCFGMLNLLLELGANPDIDMTCLSPSKIMLLCGFPPTPESRAETRYRIYFSRSLLQVLLERLI